MRARPSGIVDIELIRRDARREGNVRRGGMALSAAARTVQAMIDGTVDPWPRATPAR
jgi:hypothetical protein